MRWFCNIALAVMFLRFVLSCSIHGWPTADSPGLALDDEEMRLGSTPPSCHNRCNECNPCMAVQVPTLPAHDGFVEPSSQSSIPTDTLSSSIGNLYSNYKPLAWKCECRDHLFNP
ncbi:EPIDERMAL PATTERNING FACTOR-like protein 1 [Magnolia sinica]|uniref:EPIDERMAL PATTERNING FACTOR-like protein 1 n=1 Tax=Magnolia sinica TaxID=86752 RepID=UPI00265A2369|nr:EPIDERMAL PATTERNING FACTOR-like protein 1 [Magnolia sinica]